MQPEAIRSVGVVEYARRRLALGFGAVLLAQLLGGCTPRRGDFYEELATHERVRVEAVGTGAQLVRRYTAMRREMLYALADGPAERGEPAVLPLVFRSDSTAPSVMFRRTGSHATLDIIDRERFDEGFRVTEEVEPLD